MESPTYLSQLRLNKATVETKIEKFSASGDPEQLQHLPRLKAHLKDLNTEIDKHTPKVVEPEKPISKKHAGRK